MMNGLAVVRASAAAHETALPVSCKVRFPGFLGFPEFSNSSDSGDGVGGRRVEPEDG